LEGDSKKDPQEIHSEDGRMMNSLWTMSAGWAFVLVVLTLCVLLQESAWSRGTFFCKLISQHINVTSELLSVIGQYLHSVKLQETWTVCILYGLLESGSFWIPTHIMRKESNVT